MYCSVYYDIGSKELLSVVMDTIVRTSLDSHSELESKPEKKCVMM